LKNIISRRVDGVIVEGTKTAFPNPNVELYRRLEKMGVPVVFFNSYYRDLPDSVSPAQALKHVVAVVGAKKPAALGRRVPNHIVVAKDASIVGGRPLD